MWRREERNERKNGIYRDIFKETILGGSHSKKDNKKNDVKFVSKLVQNDAKYKITHRNRESLRDNTHPSVSFRFRF